MHQLFQFNLLAKKQRSAGNAVIYERV